MERENVLDSIRSVRCTPRITLPAGKLLSTLDPGFERRVGFTDILDLENNIEMYWRCRH